MTALPEGASRGERVRYWRLRRGRSQQLLADFAGVSREYVTMVERGKRRVDRLSTLIALADALQVPVTELAPELASAGNPVARLKDVEVVRDGHHNVVVMDSRTRRLLLRLPPEEAAALCVLIQGRAAAARSTARPAASASRKGGGGG